MTANEQNPLQTKPTSSSRTPEWRTRGEPPCNSICLNKHTCSKAAGHPRGLFLFGAMFLFKDSRGWGGDVPGV